MAKFALDDEVRAALAEAIKPIRAQWEAELAVVMAERDGARDQKEEAIRRWQAAERTLAQIGADVEAFPAMRARAESAERERDSWREGCERWHAKAQAAESALAEAREVLREAVEMLDGQMNHGRYIEPAKAWMWLRAARALASALGRGGAGE